jgi:S-adenosylhomocysteine hydrolase
MLKYNDLYKKVKEDQVADNGAFNSEYMMHWVEKTKTYWTNMRTQVKRTRMENPDV